MEVVVVRSVVYVVDCVLLALGDALRRVNRVKWLMSGRGRCAKSDRVGAALRAAITERRELTMLILQPLRQQPQLVVSFLDRVESKSKACYKYSPNYNHG